MLGVRSEPLRSWAAEWARRRQGDDAHAVTLRRRRIYILPTRFGIAFAAIVFAMLLGSMQYGASLGFALTFLLAGLGLVIMHHCHNNLLGISVRLGGAHPVFAGDEARFRIVLENGTPAGKFDIVAACGDRPAGPVDLEPGASATVELPRPALRRGWVGLPRFSVATRHPCSLFEAWTWVHMDARCLVYPEPAKPGRPEPAGQDAGGERARRDRDEEDFAGLREAVAGDSPKRLAWKAFARNDQLLVKEFAGASEQPRLFDWQTLAGLDDEARLAQLTRWCLDAAEARRSFGLVLPGAKIAVGNGDRHLHDCLQALALHGLEP